METSNVYELVELWILDADYNIEAPDGLEDESN